MGVHHPGLQMSLDDLLNMVRDQVVATLQNGAIGRDGLRVYDGGWIRVENGGLSVTGTADITGRLQGSGTFDWSGPWFLRGTGQITGNTTGTGALTWSGPWNLTGQGDITGNVDITGALDVRNRLTLGPSGYIEAGTVRLDRFGAYGGRLVSSGSVLALDAVGSVVALAPQFSANEGFFNGNLTVFGDLEAYGTISTNIKNFKIPHPTKETHLLRHGSTESPVSGVEYWGEETLPESGTLVVALPDYFEALTKPVNRAVLVTGRGFVADWGDIENGAFTVTGIPGGRFSWLVKAERKGADFLTEEATPVNRLEAKAKLQLPDRAGS